MSKQRYVAGLAALLISEAAILAAGQPGTHDPLLERQWNLDQIGAREAWAISTGRGATLAIVDTGVDLDHEDLATTIQVGGEPMPRLVDGATFLGCGDEPCGEGGHDSGPTGAAASSHGTHVAGIAAAAAGNGVGVAGVAPEVWLMPVRVGDGGFDPADMARGIRWAVDHGADVINFSLGAGVPGWELLAPTVDDVVTPLGHLDALREAVDAGVVVVAAAGNLPWPLCSDPAFQDGLVCVTAVDRRGNPATASNWGLKPDQQVVAAPGGDGSGPFLFGDVDGAAPGLPVVNERANTCRELVLSTLPPLADRSTNAQCALPGTGAYGYASGTSMAAPHVAGVAALLRSLGCDAGDTVEILLETAKNPLTGQRGSFATHYGYGIVDAFAATEAGLSRC